jgi:hypothetical protein
MKITSNGKEVIHSGTYLLDRESDTIFEFPDDTRGAKITLSFETNKLKNNGERISETILDPNGSGMTLKFYNLKSETGEGIFPKAFKLYDNNGYSYSVLFITKVFNDTLRKLTITFFKEKS